MEKNRVKITRKLMRVGDSLGITIPPQYLEYLQLQEGQEIQLMDDNSKHGRHISIWKKPTEE